MNSQDYERDFLDVALDAGATADWITPTWEAIRNVAQDGRSFIVRGDDWHGLRPELQRQRISFWGESLHWIGDAYWMAFSVHADHAETVTALTDYTPNGGRGKAWFMLFVVLAILAATLALVATVGGAL